MSLKIINVQADKGTALVKGRKRTFPVILQDWLKFLICVGDLAIVKKSPVSGEWIMTDYVRMWGDVDEEF